MPLKNLMDENDWVEKRSQAQVSAPRLPPKHLPHPFNILVDTFFRHPTPARCVQILLYSYFVLCRVHPTAFHWVFLQPPFLGDTLYWANLSWKLEEEGLVFEGKSV